MASRHLEHPVASQFATPPAKYRGPAMVPRHTAIEKMVLPVADNALTCYRQSLYNAKPTLPAIPPR